MDKKKRVIFKCLFLLKAHGIEQAPITWVFPSDTHLASESTEAMRIKSLAQGHSILRQPGFVPLVAVSAECMKQTPYP